MTVTDGCAANIMNLELIFYFFSNTTVTDRTIEVRELKREVGLLYYD